MSTSMIAQAIYLSKYTNLSQSKILKICKTNTKCSFDDLYNHYNDLGLRNLLMRKSTTAEQLHAISLLDTYGFEYLFLKHPNTPLSIKFNIIRKRGYRLNTLKFKCMFKLIALFLYRSRLSPTQQTKILSIFSNNIKLKLNNTIIRKKSKMPKSDTAKWFSQYAEIFYPEWRKEWFDFTLNETIYSHITNIQYDM